MELTAGTHVGPYEIDRRIGAGGMGVVYRARDGRLGRNVAIKVLPAGVADQPDRLRRFEQEARTIGGLNHANLVILHDVGHHEGVPYLVTELLEGRSLAARLADGGVTLREAVTFASEIARGLAAAHGAGVVHRDIKPDNIFVTGDGRVKILDFGIAKLRDHAPGTGEDLGAAATAAVQSGTAATGTGVVIGTPGYMAPEQLAGAQVDARSDIFSLGVVLFEMLARRRPFAGETNIEESYAILKGAPAPLPPNVPGAVQRIVMRCLEKRADARFQSASDLAFALEALDDVASGRISTPVAGIVITPPPVTARGTDVGTAPTAIGGPATDPSTLAPAHAATVEGAPIAAPGAITSTAPASASASTSTTARAATPTTATATAPARMGRWPLAVGAAAMVAGAAGYLVASHRSAQWPTMVEGGARFTRLTYRPQDVWYARFDHDGKHVFWSVRREKDRDKEEPHDHEWTVVESPLDRPSMRLVGMFGRILDVTGSNNEFALRFPHSDEKGGRLLRGDAGTTAPREVADLIRDASFLPDGKLAAIAVADPNGVLEAPLGTAIAKAGKSVFYALRASHDGKRIAVIVLDGPDDPMGHVALYGLDGKVDAKSATHAGIDGLAWAPNGELWFSSADGIIGLDHKGHERTLLRGFGRMGLRDVDAQGRMLIAPTTLHQRLYEQLGGETKELNWLDESQVRALSSDGKQLAFVQTSAASKTEDGYAAFVREPDGTTTRVGNAYGIGLTPDGKRAVLICGAGDMLRVVETEQGAPHGLPAGPITQLDHEDWIAMTSDGSHAVVRGAAAGGEMQLWLIDLAGKEPAKHIGPDAVRHGRHPISKDGTEIALGSSKGISIVSVADKTERTIPAPPHAQDMNNKETAMEPLQYSTDGATLYVMRTHGYPREIFALDVASGNFTLLQQVELAVHPHAFDAVMNADGTVLAYSASVELGDLYLVAPP